MTALSIKTALCLAIAAALGSSVAAPAASTPAHTASAADPGVRVAPQRYQSALQHYERLQDPAPPVVDWRAANRRVHEAGGWRAYLREAQAPAASSPTAAPPATLAPAPARPAAPQGHAH